MHIMNFFSIVFHYFLVQKIPSLYSSESTETRPDVTQKAISSLWSGLTDEVIKDISQSSLSISNLSNLNRLDKTSSKSKRVNRDPTKVIYRFFEYVGTNLCES